FFHLLLFRKDRSSQMAGQGGVRWWDTDKLCITL
ncbi:MAG: hypothetical protein ACI9XB_003897, partial [Gammaproteobacteria bacterium]